MEAQQFLDWMYIVGFIGACLGFGLMVNELIRRF